MIKILTVCGTRPEFIKLEHFLRLANQVYKSIVVVSGQHKSLLASLLAQTDISIHHHIQSIEGDCLASKLSHIIEKFAEILLIEKPDLVVVQGDTLTSFAGAMAAFYAKIDVAHIEAGLRTYQINAPWPEEMHRTAISKFARFHFAPTHHARQALLNEGVKKDAIYVVGNTSIDAVKALIPNPSKHGHDNYVVITMHRREYFGAYQQDFCRAVSALADKHKHIQFHFYLHPNPQAAEFIYHFDQCSNIVVHEPIDYREFVVVLDRAMFVITDSGGIQEESAYLGKPVVVFRACTERMEGVEAGAAILVGFSVSKLIDVCSKLITDKDFLREKSIQHNCYGHGDAAQQIIEILKDKL